MNRSITGGMSKLQIKLLNKLTIQWHLTKLIFRIKRKIRGMIRDIRGIWFTQNH